MKNKMIFKVKELSNTLMLDLSDNECEAIINELDNSIKLLSSIPNLSSVEENFHYFDDLKIPNTMESLRKDEICILDNVDKIKKNMKDLKNGLVKV